MLVVSDTTPLNYLVLIEAVDVLPALYGSVIVPTNVIAELRQDRAPEPVRTWTENLPNWVLVRTGDRSMFPLLGAGEAAALALAEEVRADALLADDTEARLAAEQLGVRTIGTLGILAGAHAAGLLDFETALAALLGTNFQVHEDVVKTVRNAISPSPEGPRGWRLGLFANEGKIFGDIVSPVDEP